jgi:PKD domain
VPTLSLQRRSHWTTAETAPLRGRATTALAKLTVPTAGKVGKRLVFKVAPKDVWTTVGAIRWSFGDGTAGSGRTTGHVYARPGTYTLKITAADAFGHATSLKRVLTISAA